MLAVYLGDPHALMRLESIRVRRPADLRGHDPSDLMQKINLEAGRPADRPSIAAQARRNLSGAAEQQPAPRQAHAHG